MAERCGRRRDLSSGRGVPCLAHEERERRRGSDADDGEHDRAAAQPGSPGNGADRDRPQEAASVADQTPEPEKLASRPLRREISAEGHHRAGAESIADSDHGSRREECAEGVGQGDQRDATGHYREARDSCRLAAVAIHQVPGRDEHRDVEQRGDGHDQADLRRVQADDIGAEDRHEKEPPGADHLGKCLSDGGGGKIAAILAKHRTDDAPAPPPAAFDGLRRIAGDVAHSEREGERPVPHYWEHVLWVWGHDDLDTFLDFADDIHLNGVVEKIAVPFLVVHGQNDRQIPLQYAHQSYEQAVNSPKRELRVFTPDEGATEHIGLDHLPLVSSFVADWVAGTFAELDER